MHLQRNIIGPICKCGDMNLCRANKTQHTYIIYTHNAAQSAQINCRTLKQRR